MVESTRAGAVGSWKSNGLAAGSVAVVDMEDGCKLLSLDSGLVGTMGATHAALGDAILHITSKRRMFIGPYKMGCHLWPRHK